MQKSEPTIEEIYQKRTQLEHILLRPDTYVGSSELQTHEMFVYDAETKSLMMKKVNIVPALYKIFDEILVNAVDNMSRDPSGMNLIDVSIDKEEARISIMNNGRGVPIQLHKEHNLYVPELVFGQLLTSDNYNDTQKKTVGGRNGYGAKLANVFSKKFIVETADASTRKAFRQTFERNMMDRHTPEISTYTGEAYTRITFWPDLKRFGMSCLDDDIISLMTKRAYDAAGSTASKCKVRVNGNELPVSGFKEYVQMYFGEVEGAPPCMYEKCSDCWEVAVSVTDWGFQQVSLVNSICTTKGGTHVAHVTEQLVEAILKVVKGKNRGGIEIKPGYVKNHLWVFVRCLVQNPSFDSQTKETLTTKPMNFGSTCEVSDKLIRQVLKSGVVEKLLDFAKAKQKESLGQKLRGQSDQTRVHGIPKLEDANDAGGENSGECTLILTEGDSAKSLAVAGLGVIGRDRYGIFPLKGKLLNVRDASYKQVTGNQEIQNLLKIIGLDTRAKYSSARQLRYGHIMLMTDQDHDGSHIKGLLINLFHHWWPSLVQLEGFLQEFITPIVKVWQKGSNGVKDGVKSFYTLREYEEFKRQRCNRNPWSAKYYKGLGTSTSHEAKEYFRNIHSHTLSFKWTGEGDGEAIDLAFNRKRADDRKSWINACEESAHVDHSQTHVTYHEFVNKELVHFAKYDVQRSVPSMVDGFKPSQRKVMFGAFKRKLNNDIKVAQLVGYISEQSAYHHGEASLENTIVNLAQNFVGSNNLNLLVPSGQFGTRLQGGKDRAAARYIHTRLSPVARFVFHPDDDAVLDYLEEEGQQIEPTFYCPVIPTVLVNGAEGIGVGWSTSVPNFNPREIIQNIRRRLQGERMHEMTPWYKGFKGTITANEKEIGKFEVSGQFERSNDDVVEITELPVKTWTQNYKEFLEELIPQPLQSAVPEKDCKIIEDYREYNTETNVHFAVKLDAEKMLQTGVQDLAKTLKLKSQISTANMILFNGEGKITRYTTALEILEDFCRLRLEVYAKRKAHLVSKLTYEEQILSNQARFILMVVKGELELRNKMKADLLQELVARGFSKMTALTKTFSQKVHYTSHTYKNEGQREQNSSVNADMLEATDFDYLLGMDLWSLTHERVDQITKLRELKIQELDLLTKSTVEELWSKDLQLLSDALDNEDSQESAESEGLRAKALHQTTFEPKLDTLTKKGYPFSVGERVEYWSKSMQKWLLAEVLVHHDDGSCDLNLKRGAQPENIRKVGASISSLPAQACEKISLPTEREPETGAPHACPSVDTPGSANLAASPTTHTPSRSINQEADTKNFRGKKRPITSHVVPKAKAGAKKGRQDCATGAQLTPSSGVASCIASPDGKKRRKEEHTVQINISKTSTASHRGRGARGRGTSARGRGESRGSGGKGGRRGRGNPEQRLDSSANVG